MDPGLEDINRQALKDALATGFGHLGQAVLAVQWVVPFA